MGDKLVNNIYWPLRKDDSQIREAFQIFKRAARIILDAERLTPSVVLFNNLNWLPFTKQSLIKRCALVYKRVHNYITPIYLNSLLVRNSEIHNRATRHSNINLVCPKYKRKTEGGHTFTIRTIKDWNCMNANIRNNGSLASFKHNVFKSFLAEQKAAMLLSRGGSRVRVQGVRTANSTNPPIIKNDKKDPFCLLTKRICQGCQSSVFDVQSYDQTSLAV